MHGIARGRAVGENIDTVKLKYLCTEYRVQDTLRTFC
jgi:hypothetical protein